MLLGLILAFLESLPSAPSPDEWAFRRELAEPVEYAAKTAYRIIDEYGLKDETETVRTDLERFMASAARAVERTVTLRRGAVGVHESYRVEVLTNGDVVLTAGDDDGIRRAAAYFEDRVQAGDLRSVTRTPWLRNRISRCFFGPIKRPPFNRDELMDDIDYYPDEYLNRLAHEGINGLWLTVELRNLVKTSFNERDPDAPRRLAKLRRTVEKCRRYGIRTWLFCIEPRRMEADCPLLAKFPPEALADAAWGGGKVLCPSSAATRRYLEEAFRDLFEQVPGLPGVINISHGERPTTCLSAISPVNGERSTCPRCAELEPWRIHAQTAGAIVRGMRSVNPQAEFISWFYHPQVDYRRASWVAEVARHLPEGVTMLYNFESGAVKEQLGRYRPGGDYWLSYVGPSPSFGQVAAASREAGGLLGAKIQVGCSHECATVPFVPVPGLLYRKYRAMREARCSTVMQCWYFGNCPGVMNKAAGELAFHDFSDGEEDFLLALARPDWGEDAPMVARLWKTLSDAYANYPLSNDMQYYGPFHAGVVWPLHPGVEMRRLARTWKPLDAPSGDVIGECLENHTLDEAAILADRMRDGVAAADGIVAALERKYAGNRARMRDLGVVRALKLLFTSAADIFEFYRLREIAVSESRFGGDHEKALAAVAGMRERIVREQAATAALLPIVHADSRLGFHSEAEIHQFHEKRLEWRRRQLKDALKELDVIAAELAAGRSYPLSEHERRAPVIKAGEPVKTAEGYAFTVRFLANGDFEVVGQSPTAAELTMRTFNGCATAWPLQVMLRPDGYSVPDRNVVAPTAVVKVYEPHRDGKGWRFRLVLDARVWASAKRPGWINFSRAATSVWPTVSAPSESRLNLGPIPPEDFGRIL